MHTQLHKAANPQTKPADLSCDSASRLLSSTSPSPFAIITQPESWYSFYCPTDRVEGWVHLGIVISCSSFQFVLSDFRKYAGIASYRVGRRGGASRWMEIGECLLRVNNWDSAVLARSRTAQNRQIDVQSTRWPSLAQLARPLSIIQSRLASHRIDSSISLSAPSVAYRIF